MKPVSIRLYGKSMKLKEELKDMPREELEYLLIRMNEFYTELDEFLCEKIGKDRYLKYLEEFTKKKISEELKAKVYDTVKELTGSEEREDLN